MMFLTKILLRIYILSILPITVTSTYSSQTGLIALPNSEIPITNSDSIVNPFVDLNNANQADDHTFKIPEFKPKKRKHNPGKSSENQIPKRRKTTKKKFQDNFSGENAAGYLGEFRHELSKAFLYTKVFFKYKSYFKMILAPNDSVFIEEFCGKEQLKNINTSLYHRLDNEMIGTNFVKLETYTKRVVAGYVEIFKNKSEDRSKLLSISYLGLKKGLDPVRTKGLYYLLVYSFYETGLIGIPKCMAAVEKIFVNIITHARLMAYVHNGKVKEEMKSKKLCSSLFVPSEMSKYEQSNYSRTNFIYTDFTKALTAKSFDKHDLFCKNADLMRKEINDNIQLIIDKEFSEDPACKKLCENYNSKALRLNTNILYERFPFKIGNHVSDNFLCDDEYYNSIMYVNGYPRNMLSYLMDTDTKNQIKDLPDIKLKSVFILIFISKICLCNVTHLCTLPEYLILIGSLQEAYNKHKPGQDTIADFQSLTSYFFSLHYLDNEQVAGRREESKKIIENVFPEYNKIFPNFDSEIDKLKDE